LCKVLKENAAKLYSGIQGDPGGGFLEPSVSLGENLENAGFSVFSKTRTIVFERNSAVSGDSLRALQSPTDGGSSGIEGLHGSEEDR